MFRDLANSSAVFFILNVDRWGIGDLADEEDGAVAPVVDGEQERPVHGHLVLRRAVRVPVDDDGDLHHAGRRRFGPFLLHLYEGLLFGIGDNTDKGIK